MTCPVSAGKRQGQDLDSVQSGFKRKFLPQLSLSFSLPEQFAVCFPGSIYPGRREKTNGVQGQWT